MPNEHRNAIRRTFCEIRNKISPRWQQEASAKICTRIRSLPQYRYAQHIALYHAIHKEVDLSALWRSASQHGKMCYLPKINEDYTLSFLPAPLDTVFQKNHLGILEPIAPAKLMRSPQELDLIIAPVVAFDQRGNRLGMGQGCYDRTLANARPPLLLGVAYEFQHHIFLGCQPWDVPLNAIVTESTIYWSNQ